MLKIGIIGCGAIGSYIAKEIEKTFSKKARVCALCDIDKNQAIRLSKSLKTKPLVCSQDTVFKKSDLVVEASSSKFSASIAKNAITSGCDVLIMSVGGLLSNTDLFKLAEKKNRRIYVPSGAICGIDGVKASNIKKIKKAILTTTKPIEGLKGAPYVVKQKINLDKINGSKVIFTGNALRAAKAFPQNINVAATLALAGIGSKKTQVKIIASSKIKRNIHKIELETESGKIITETQNIPSPDNPKTSYLAMLSAVATLKEIFNPIKIGT
ncbi:MAG: aspartate dehydrogenase [Candidatus Omnitrophota bacterium]